IQVRLAGTSAAVALTDELRVSVRVSPKEEPVSESTTYESAREFVRLSYVSHDGALDSQGPLVLHLVELLSDPVEPATLQRLAGLHERLEQWDHDNGRRSDMFWAHKPSTGPSVLLRETPLGAEPALDPHMVEIPGGSFRFGLSDGQLAELVGSVWV